MHVCSVVTPGAHWPAVSHVKYDVDIRFGQSHQCVWVSYMSAHNSLVCVSEWCGVEPSAGSVWRLLMRPVCFALPGTWVREKCKGSHLVVLFGACQCCT